MRTKRYAVSVTGEVKAEPARNKPLDEERVRRQLEKLGATTVSYTHLDVYKRQGNRSVPFSRELYVDGDDFMEVPVKKYFRLFPGNEVRFKGAYFIRCEEVIKNEDGSIKELRCTYDPQTRSGSCLLYTSRCV